MLDGVCVCGRGTGRMCANDVNVHAAQWHERAKRGMTERFPPPCRCLDIGIVGQKIAIVIRVQFIKKKFIPKDTAGIIHLLYTKSNKVWEGPTTGFFLPFSMQEFKFLQKYGVTFK